MNSNMRACPPCSYLSIFAQKLLLYRILASKTSAVLVTGMSCSMLTLYMSHVHSIPEFNSPVWNPTKVGKIQAMLGVQKTFTSRFSAVRSHDYWKLKVMSFMSQQRRRERYIILSVKFLNHKACHPFFCQRMLTAESISVRDHVFLTVLRARLWNEVPVYVNSLKSYLLLKEKL